MHDLRLAVRSIRGTPVVSMIAILTLALGIGANTAIFSLVNGLLLRQLPVTDPSALVLVTDGTVPGVRAYAYAVWDSFRRYVDLFDGALAWSATEFKLAAQGETHVVSGVWVSGSYFEALGVPPLLGRTLTAADDQPGGGPGGAVAVISHGFWQRRFGGAGDVIGRTLELDGGSFTVVGVTPPHFSGVDVGRTIDVVVPFGTASQLLGRESLPPVTIMARLRTGQTREAAMMALRRVQPQIREASLPRGTNWRTQDLDAYLRDGFVLLPGATGSSRLRLKYERSLLMLMVVVALVLLTACANIANLLLARTVARQHELEVRMALGAGRWRLVRALLAESLVLAGAGATVGTLIGSVGSRWIVRQISTPANPIDLDLSIDASVAVFTIAVTAAVTLLFGIAPALRAMNVRPSGSLKGHHGSSGQTGLGPSAVLIVAQVALSLVLVVGAGLFLRTFLSLIAVPLGFEPERVLTASVSADDARARPDQRLPLFERTREAIRSLPGVTEAAFSFLTPVSGPILLRPVELADGRSLPERERLSSVNLVSPGWFRTLGTRIVAGREFTDADRAGTSPVVVVNQSFARKFLKGENPLGRIVTVGIVGPNAGSAEVVGVAADAVYSSLREPVPPTMYFPLAQLRNAPPASLTLSVRSERGAPQVLARSVAAAIATVSPAAEVMFRPLADQIDASLVQERTMAMLSGFFGGLALLLAGLGLFGVTSYSVSRRRREIGIRMALGAARNAVLRLVLARVFLSVGTGVVIGAGVSLWATQFAASLLFGLAPRDPSTFTGAAVLLMGVGVLAALPPAWHAARIDPAVVLRAE